MPRKPTAAAMSPRRALSIALNAVLLEDYTEGVWYPPPTSRVDVAGIAGSLALRAITKIPEGWGIVATKSREKDVLAELRDVSQRLAEFAATNHFLLAMRLIQDGHAKDLREAGRTASDLDKVRALYPVPDDDPDPDV